MNACNEAAAPAKELDLSDVPEFPDIKAKGLGACLSHARESGKWRQEFSGSKKKGPGSICLTPEFTGSLQKKEVGNGKNAYSCPDYN
jgi:hypothetical protein